MAALARTPVFQRSLVAGLKQRKSTRTVARAVVAPKAEMGLMPEFGTYPGGPGESPVVPFTDSKNADREIIHGRFAMLAVTGAYTAERYSGVPWYEAGALCTPESCQPMIDAFPGAVEGLNVPGNDTINFWFVILHEFILMGTAECYRTGALPVPSETFENIFPELDSSSPYPGGRFDPLKISEQYSLEDLKVRELKHGRIAMVAWMGCVDESLLLKEGPYSLLMKHIADPVHNNIMSPSMYM
mmetsp:Transcript_11323/g.41437  ORF Transcript_11323/g.41437 Transcript_11323/m.41437 type:complete len:243 (+) Transcript_11323:84-812(+)